MISTITWMEVMVGAKDDEITPLEAFLANFQQVSIDKRVAEKAVEIRRQTRIRLPDAIIWASAQHENAMLVSRNRKDFPPDAPDVRMSYKL